LDAVAEFQYVGESVHLFRYVGRWGAKTVLSGLRELTRESFTRPLAQTSGRFLHGARRQSVAATALCRGKDEDVMKHWLFCVFRG
jgi:hypothetical protein